MDSFHHCVTKVLWSFFPVSRMIRTFTASETKVTEWHSRRLLGPQARGVQTETIFCYVLPPQLHGIFFFNLFSQIPSEYFTFLAVQIYSFGFLSHLIMSGPDLLGGYGDRFRDTVTHLLGSPGKVDTAGPCKTYGSCIVEQSEAQGSVGRRI